jgi:hypothetical protein
MNTLRIISNSREHPARSVQRGPAPQTHKKFTPTEEKIPFVRKLPTMLDYFKRPVESLRARSVMEHDRFSVLTSE